jgi:hypothetical protein
MRTPRRFARLPLPASAAGAALLLLLLTGAAAPAQMPQPATTAEGVSAPPAGSPQIVCEQPVFNFGEADESVSVSNLFVLVNRGTAPLQIGRVTSSCGCTVASVSRRELAPGESATLAARMTLKGRRGPQNKSVTVESNDPRTPALALWINGSVTVEVGLDPMYVNFGSVAPGASPSMAVALLSRDPRVEISGISAAQAGGAFQAEVVPDAGGLKRRLSVRFQPGQAMDGFFREEFEVRTTHPGYPTLRLPASAVVPQPVQVIPRMIQVTTGTTGLVNRALLLRTTRPEGLRILGVTPPVPGIQARSSALGPRSYRIELTGIPPDAALNGQALLIETDVPGFEKVRVPFEILGGAP